MNTITLAKAQLMRYIGLIIGIIFMIMSIRVYVNNYLIVETNIQQTQREITRTQSENDFMKNFQIPYLQSDLAKRMLMHHQGIVDKGGTLVMIDYSQDYVTDTPDPSEVNTGVINDQSWAGFIISRWRASIN